MKVDPTRSGQTRGTAPERLNDPAASPPLRQDRGAAPSPSSPGGDRIELSEGIRELQQSGLERAAGSSLSPGRIRDILQKLSNGFYERPEVREDVLRRLRADLDDTPPGR